MGFSSQTRNLLQMSVGLMLVFLAFFSQSFIEETVLSDRNYLTNGSVPQDAGYMSQTIIYGTFLFSNLIAPPLVAILGCRWSLLLGSSTMTILMASFLALNTTLLYMASALEGFGSAILWTAVGHYLALNSNEYTVGRNSSLLWTFHTSGLIFGGVFLLIVFGIHQVDTIGVSLTNLLYGVFAAISLVGNIIFALLPTPKEERDYYIRAGSYKNELVSTFKVFFTRDMLLFSFTSAFAGLEMPFWSGVYSTALSFTSAFKMNTNILVALNSIAVGIGQITASIAFGVYGDRTIRKGRWPIMLFSSCLGCFAFLLSYLNLPADSTRNPDTNEGTIVGPSITIALFCGCVFGVVDAATNTQIYSLASVLFEDCTPQAFAISKFFHALLSTICMFYGGKFNIGSQLLILSIGSIASVITFYKVEKDFMKRRNIQKLTESEQELERRSIVADKVQIYGENIS